MFWSVKIDIVLSVGMYAKLLVPKNETCLIANVVYTCAYILLNQFFIKLNNTYNKRQSNKEETKPCVYI